ncbi:MAG: response regulator [Verrucomicrobia bacterium]|nr:response regulator [Verrucomicrobiota bacterium]
MNKHKILVIDDNPIVQSVYKRKLEALGYDVMTANDGAGAVSQIRANGPDLALVDLTLPDHDGMSPVQWDGFIVVEWMKRLHLEKKIPFIVVTASQSPANREKALSVGASAYFNKSVPFEEIAAAIKTALENAAPTVPATPAGGTS